MYRVRDFLRKGYNFLTDVILNTLKIILVISLIMIIPWLISELLYGTLGSIYTRLIQSISHNALVHTGSREVWISFYGSFIGAIIGGVITLIAVTKTINSGRHNTELITSQTSKQIKIQKDALQVQFNYYEEQRRLQVAPCIIIESDFNIKLYQLTGDFDHRLILKNAGMGPLLDLQITRIYEYRKRDIYSSIPVNGTMEFYPVVKIENLDKAQLLQDIDFFEIKYKDILYNTYRQILSIKNLTNDYNSCTDDKHPVAKFVLKHRELEIKHKD